MKIIIYQNREVYKEESKIGNDSENKVETLEFEFPEEYKDFTKYIEFQIKGGKYVDLIEDNKYVITREVAKYGKIKTQLVLKKNIENDVLIFKSNVFELNVSKSINASENLVNTVGVDLIEKIVTKNNEQDFRLDALEADNTTNKENISNLQNDNTTNKSDIKSLQDDNEVNKTDISNIKQEQTTQNINISNLQTDNTSNKSKILDLEAKNTKQDTNIQKNAESIAEINAKDTAQDKLIEQLQAENTKLKKEINSMQIPGEATGNPIHLTDSSDMECEIVPIGNAEQETREGYNKFNPTMQSSEFSSGTKVTKNLDNTYKLEGGANDRAELFLIGTFDVTEGETYTLSGGINGNNALSFRRGKAIVSSTGDAGIVNYTATQTETLNIYLRYQSVDTIIYKPMILKGTYTADTILPYEPYGASPSPDYPSEIVTVGQNVNLFDKDNANILNGYVVNDKEDISADANARTLYIPCDANTDYTISKLASRLNVGYSVDIPTLGGTVCNVVNAGKTATKTTYKTGDDAKYLVVFYHSMLVTSPTEQEVLDSIKIEKGTVATPWSPYGQGSVEIEVCNKNLFVPTLYSNNKKINQSNAIVTLENDTFAFECTSGDMWFGNIISEGDKYIESSGKLIPVYNFSTLSVKIVNELFTKNFLTCFDENLISLGYKQFYSSNILNNYSLPEGTKYVTLRFGMPPSVSTVGEIYKTQVQIEPGELTDYIPHEGYTKVLPIQKEFVKIGDYEDTFVKVDGKWYEKHYSTKIIFDGTESWTYDSERYRFYKTIPNSLTSQKSYALSSHFKNGNTETDNNAFNIGAKQIFFRNESIASTSDWKSWLAEQYNAGTPVIVYYILETPELIPCTAEQEEILNSFYTYKNITNISVDGIGTLKVNYKKDLETLFNNVNDVMLGGN